MANIVSVPVVSTGSKSRAEGAALVLPLQSVLRRTSVNISEKALGRAIAVGDFLLLPVVSLRIELSGGDVITEREFLNWLSLCSDGSMHLVQVVARQLNDGNG